MVVPCLQGRTIGWRRSAMVADREGDVYEDFACKPGAVEVLCRAAHDRLLADGSHLFARAETLPEAGRMTVDLAAGPGRRARTAVLALRYCRVEIARPVSHKRPAADLAALPRSVTLTLVEAREIGAPATVPAVHWRLLTTRSEEH